MEKHELRLTFLGVYLFMLIILYNIGIVSNIVIHLLGLSLIALYPMFKVLWVNLERLTFKPYLAGFISGAYLVTNFEGDLESLSERWFEIGDRVRVKSLGYRGMYKVVEFDGLEYILPEHLDDKICRVES